MSGRAQTAAPSPATRASLASDVRLALRRSDAARAIGVSDEVFDAHVRPYVPVVRLGSVCTYPVRGLEAWLDREGGIPADEVKAGRG